MILNYFSISACNDLLKFDMKMFVNIARLDIGQSKHKAGASVYFGHISHSVLILLILFDYVENT